LADTEVGRIAKKARSAGTIFIDWRFSSRSFQVK